MSGVALQRLTGRIAVITAATQGIGFAIAQRLGQEGAKVIISSRKAERVSKAVKELCKQSIDVKGVVCHVAHAEDRRNLFEEAKAWGGIDILVSNAATSPAIGTVLNCSEEVWDKIFEINVKCSYLLAKEALPLLRKSKAGRIIFNTSISAFQANDIVGAYSVSKTALLGLTKAAALELANDEITVNSVAPGIITTQFSAVLTAPTNVETEALSKIPLNRLGRPHDISGVVAFLASDDAAYITGENIVVAGGMASRL